MSEPPARARVTARHVALLAAAAVALVLGLQVLSAYVPAVRDVFQYWPLLIVGLVVVTVLVLFGALRPRRR